MNPNSIESMMKEHRVFAPDEEFSEHAHIRSMEQYRALYEKSLQDPEAFWGEMADALHWFARPREILVDEHPHARWFVGGTTNISYNCLDRHLSSLRRNKAAILWEGEPGETRTLTYQQLHREVCRFANVLRKLGVRTGDRVAIYMGMVPEIAIAMLACARIGAPHTVIFGGFAAEAVRDRVNDAKASLLVTCDGAWRRGHVVPLKSIVDKAIAECPSVRHTVVFKRTGERVNMEPGRDHYWQEVMEAVTASSTPLPVESEHPLFILYTSGTTGKPKGVVHTTGGYMVGTHVTTKYVFDLRENDTYFCTADVGWITGHSYVVYGPLLNGATVLMYEGAPNFPDAGRLWQLAERWGVTIFYTAPTAIRAFMRWGEQWPMKADLSALRLLGTVGEPINPEAWMWYQRVIGNARCPVVDTWWQTETGAIMIAPLPGATPTKPGARRCPSSASRPTWCTRTARAAAGVAFSSSAHGPRCCAPSSATAGATTVASDVRDTAGDGAPRARRTATSWTMARRRRMLAHLEPDETAEIERAGGSPRRGRGRVVGQPDGLKGQGAGVAGPLRPGFAATNELGGAGRPWDRRSVASRGPTWVRFSGLQTRSEEDHAKASWKEIAAGRRGQGRHHDAGRPVGARGARRREDDGHGVGDTPSSGARVKVGGRYDLLDILDPAATAARCSGRRLRDRRPRRREASRTGRRWAQTPAGDHCGRCRCWSWCCPARRGPRRSPELPGDGARAGTPFPGKPSPVSWERHQGHHHPLAVGDPGARAPPPGGAPGHQA